MTAHGGHNFPGSKDFDKVLDDFVARTLKLNDDFKPPEAATARPALTQPTAVEYLFTN